MSSRYPAASEFFASPAGVCVDVKVGSEDVRVEFQGLDGLAIARGGSAADVAQAMAVASVALERHREELLPLFQQVSAHQFEG